MPKRIKIELSPEQRKELETGYKSGHCHFFRQRCRIILLKSEVIPSRLVVPVVGITSEKSINQWVKRYREHGVAGLRNLPGQGRKSILDESNVELVKTSVRNERQRLMKAKEMIEEQLGRRFDLKTLKRFLKNLAVDISE